METIQARETLSAAEARFEHWRRTIGLFLGPAAFLLILVPEFPSLTPQAHSLAAILGWVVLWWVTEPVPLPVTALLGALLCILLGTGGAQKVFSPFAHPLIFLFMGGFILARAMSLHRLDRRIAFAIMSLPWVGNSSRRILFTFGAIAAFLSMWISNTAATAMLFPIGLGIVSTMVDAMPKNASNPGNPGSLRFGTAMMLMAAYASSTGGIGTPVGTPPNLIGIGLIEKFTGTRIPFFQWMSFALPLLILMYIFLYLLLVALHKPETDTIPGGRKFIISEKQKMGSWSRGEKNVMAAFLLAVILWIVPGFLALFLGTEHAISKTFNRIIPEAAVAVLAALILFLLPLNWKKREFTITWKDAVRIDWGTLLLFGGGLTLGNLMFESGLADAVGKGLLGLTGADSLWGITFAAVFIAVLVSEATSNTASANMVVPVIISLALAAGVNPIPPAIGAILGASWGFMLPVSTPPNAIVYGSGLVPIRKMIRAGIVFDAAGGILIWIALRLLLPVVGLA